MGIGTETFSGEYGDGKRSHESITEKPDPKGMGSAAADHSGTGEGNPAFARRLCGSNKSGRQPGFCGSENSLYRAMADDDMVRRKAEVSE